MAVAVFAHRRVDALGRRAQRELAQRDQVALAEEILRGVPRLVGHVDLALGKALEQFVGRQIDELDFVGAGEHAIGHGLAHVDAGDLRDDVVQAFEMLHVDRRVDIDAGGEQFLDVLPALGMARAGMVAVRELVDDEQLRLARERAVEIEFGQYDAAMLEAHRRQDFEALEQRFGFGAAVQLDVADHDVDAVAAAGAARLRASRSSCRRRRSRRRKSAAGRAARATSSSLTRASRASGSGRRSGAVVGMKSAAVERRFLILAITDERTKGRRRARCRRHHAATGVRVASLARRERPDRRGVDPAHRASASSAGRRARD